MWGSESKLQLLRWTEKLQISHHGIKIRRKYGDVKAHIDLQHYSRVSYLPQHRKAPNIYDWNFGHISHSYFLIHWTYLSQHCIFIVQSWTALKLDFVVVDSLVRCGL